MGKKVIFTDKLHKPVNMAYSYATRVEARSNLLFISGMIPVDSQGKLVGKGDMKTQIEQDVENLKTVLKAAGATLTDVVKLNMYTTNIEAFLKTGKWRTTKYKELWSINGAACTLVEVKRLYDPNCLIEIEAVAEIK